MEAIRLMLKPTESLRGNLLLFAEHWLPGFKLRPEVTKLTDRDLSELREMLVFIDGHPFVDQRRLLVENFEPMLPILRFQMGNLLWYSEKILAEGLRQATIPLELPVFLSRSIEELEAMQRGDQTVELPENPRLN